MKDSYVALTNSELKLTTAKALSKYWMNISDSRQLGTVKPSVYHLGEDYIVKFVMLKGLDNQHSLTLGQLAESRVNEQENLVQFSVVTSLVEKILNGDHGLLKGNRLMKPIDVGYLPGSDLPMTVSGRHRTVALLTMFRDVEGWEELVVPVNVVQFSGVKEASDYIVASNTSRAMTATEKAQIKLTHGGTVLSVTDDNPESFYEQAEKASSVTELKTLARLIGVAATNGTVLEEDTTQNVRGDIASVFFNTLCSELNGLSPKTADVMMETHQGTLVFEAVMSKAIEVLVANWPQLVKEYARKMEKNRDGTPKLDAEGQTIYKTNIAIAARTIGKHLASVMFEGLKDTLVGLSDTKKLAIKAEKEAKSMAKVVSSLETELRNLKAQKQNFDDMGIDSSGFDKVIAAKQDELDKARGTAQPTVDNDVFN